MLGRGSALSIVTWPEHTQTHTHKKTHAHRHFTHIQFNYVYKKWFLLQRENVFSSVLCLRLSISAS